jgi:hypothetical protein
MARSIAVISLVLTCAAASAGQGVKRLTACDIIRQGRQLDQQVIRFRGLVELDDPGTKDETIDSVVVTCNSENPKQLRIKVRAPESRFLANPPTGFKLDAGSISTVQRMLETAFKRGHIVRHFEASVDAWIRFLPEQSDEGPKPKYYVAEPRYPVYLIIQAIRDVRLL